MHVLALYALTVLIWGSTWIAITFQLGVVPEAVSLVWRFLLASLCLFSYALVRRKPILLPAREHGFIALQGVALFGVNYLLVYFATGRVTSGLVAVVFSTIVFWNLINERIFFRTRIEPRVLVAAGLGLGGIVLIFLPEVRSLSLEGQAVQGVLFALGGTWLASLGNMAAVRNTRRGLPVVRLNAWGMLYGGLALAIVAWVRGQSFAIEWTPQYLLSLGYLALLGSAAAFGCYLLLIHRIGSARAAYAAVLFPVVALLLSTVFEGYHWRTASLLGVALVLGGNALALTGRSRHASLNVPAGDGRRETGGGRR